MNDRGGKGSDDLSRYARQMLFAPLGEQGQRLLGRACAAVVGCGALGSGVIAGLARAGVGKLVLIDRDFVEWTDLHRQVLFDESDARESLPKAVAAAEKVGRMNGRVEVEARVEHLGPDTAEARLAASDLIVDGTDNLEARFLLNDLSVKLGKPWIYGGCVGSRGTSMTVLPGATPCFRCVYPEPPPTGEVRTCDTAGVLQPAAAMVSAWQTAEALKILSGHRERACRSQLAFDIWTGEVSFFAKDRDPDCPCCGRGRLEFLSGSRASRASALCGRNAVQIVPETRGEIDLADLARRLAPAGRVTENRFLVRFDDGAHVLTVFRDGRVIVQGATDPGRARALCSRYLGL